MTWLKGQTTWANFTDKICALATGEVSDDFSVVTALPDRWTRKVAGQNTLCSPAAVAVPHTAQPMRAGYAAPVYPVGDGGLSFRQMSLFTALPYARTRVLFNVYNNPTGGSTYANLNVYVRFVNEDTLAETASVVAPSAAGDFTFFGATFRISHPSGYAGIAVANSGTTQSTHVRSATTTYTGGIDFWPMLSRRLPSSAVTFPTPPPGVSGTDYAVIEEARTTYGDNSSVSFWRRGGHAQGLGIKTATALTGDLYTVTFDMAKQMFTPYSLVQGQVGLRLGGLANDPNGGVSRQVGGGLGQGWLQCFQTPASVLSGSLIQYWMKVTRDGIVVVANGDPGQSGVLGVAGTFTLDADTLPFDKFNAGFSPVPNSYLTDNSSDFRASSEWGLYQQYLIANNDRNRDYAIGYMRPSLEPGDQSNQYPISTLWPAGGMFGPFSENAVPNFELKPEPFTGKWTLYPHVYNDTRMSYSNSVDVRGQYRRGTCTTLPFIPGLGWTTGDELTDTVTGNKYFLIAADYASGPFSRMRWTNNTYAGGCAILEN